MNAGRRERDTPKASYPRRSGSGFDDQGSADNFNVAGASAESNTTRTCTGTETRCAGQSVRDGNYHGAYAEANLYLNAMN